MLLSENRRLFKILRIEKKHGASRLKMNFRKNCFLASVKRLLHNTALAAFEVRQSYLKFDMSAKTT